MAKRLNISNTIQINRLKMTKQFIFSAVIVNIKQSKLWIWDMAVETGGSHGCDSA